MVGFAAMILTLACTVAWSPVIYAQSLGKSPEKSNPAKTEIALPARDLTGVWMESGNEITFSPTDPPLQPWAQEKFESAKPGYGPRASADSHDPILKCLPPGMPRIMLFSFPIQIVQTPGQVIMIFEYDHFVRQIYMNRQDHPKDFDPSWMGDSVGRWEGNTLVVDTVGLNDKSWLDQVGHPHSDALHIVERLRRVDHDTLQNDITFDDPKTYTKPWTGRQIFKLKPSWHLMEFVCEDTMEPSR